MKFYKLDNTKILEAKNTNPLDCVFGDGVYSFYVSQSDELLKAPFEKITKEDLPELAIKQMKEGLSLTKTELLNKTKEMTERIIIFKSDVLGQMHYYDMDKEDQLNLSQAREYLSLMPDERVKIRCTNLEGIKDNLEHTKEQVDQLFKDWIVSKNAILNAYSTFKIDLENALIKSEADLAFEKFNKEIK